MVEALEAKTLLAVDLALSISDGDVSVSPGDPLTYTYLYSNDGDEDASGVIIRTHIPAGTTFDEAGSSAGWECHEEFLSLLTACRLPVGDLATGASGEATLAVTVDSDLSRLLLRIENLATIRGDQMERERFDNHAHESTPVILDLPDLQVDLDDGGVEVSPGDQITYSLAFSNQGSADAGDVVVVVPVPARTTFDSDASSPEWSCTDEQGGGICRLDVGALAAGEDGTASFVVTLNDEIPFWARDVHALSLIHDRATNGHDANPRDNRDHESTPIVQQAADLSLSIDDGDVVAEPDGSIVYVLNYANEGSEEATGVVITQRLARGTALDEANSTAGWTCETTDRLGTICTFDVGTLAGGEEGSIQLAVTVDSELRAGARRLITVARIRGEQTDSNPLNNFAFASTPVARDDDDILGGLFAWRRR